MSEANRQESEMLSNVTGAADTTDKYDEPATPAHTTTSHIGPTYDANGNIIESTVVESRVGGTVTTTTVTTSSASRRGSTASTANIDVPVPAALAPASFASSQPQSRAARVTGGVASLMNVTASNPPVAAYGTTPSAYSQYYAGSVAPTYSAGPASAMSTQQYNTMSTTGYNSSMVQPYNSTTAYSGAGYNYGTAYNTATSNASVAGGVGPAYSVSPSVMTQPHTSNVSMAGAMSQGTVISKEQLSVLTHGKEEQVSYVEVEVEEERIIHVTVPKYETVLVEKKVPREEWIERIEEVVEYNDVTREVLGPQQIIETIRDVEVPVEIEKPVDKPVYKTVVEVVTKEETRHIEVLEVQPKNVQVPVRYNVPIVSDHTQPVVVAQTFQPVLGVSTDSMTVNVRQWEFTPVHIDVPIPKAVPIQVKMGQYLRTTHAVVSVPAAHWNSLVQTLNASSLAAAPEFEALLPFVRQIGSNYVPLLPASEPLQMVAPNQEDWRASYNQMMATGQQYAVMIESGYSFTHVEQAVSEIVTRRREQARAQSEAEGNAVIEQAMVVIQREQIMIEERNRITMQKKPDNPLSSTGPGSNPLGSSAFGRTLNTFGQPSYPGANYPYFSGGPPSAAVETSSVYGTNYSATANYTSAYVPTSNYMPSNTTATFGGNSMATRFTNSSLPGAFTAAGTAASRFSGVALGDFDAVTGGNRPVPSSAMGSTLPGHFNGSLQTSPVEN